MDVTKSESVASAYLRLLASRDVDYLFGNAGTDFAPIIEAYAALAYRGIRTPVPVLATHENLAVTMAHGYGMVSGRVPAVMVHVSVGTANVICGAMNAARENVAMLLTAGRTPITEQGRLGSRDGYIHWAQEMYDQAGMIREIVKWDYELRNGDQLETVVDRALAMAVSEPKGVVYLSLPREVLAEGRSNAVLKPARMCPATAPAPNPGALSAAAKLIASSERPLIVTCNAGRDASGFEALSRFARRHAVPVIQHKPRYLSLPSSHEMNLGYESYRLVPQADVILAIECDVPWMPAVEQPATACKIIQAGLDPLHSRIPVRGFPSDITITGDTALTLEGLSALLDGSEDRTMIPARERWAAGHRRPMLVESTERLANYAGVSPLDPAWVSHCISRAKDENAIVINEYTLLLDYCHFEHAGCYFGSSAVSGLGWGAGAALGAKLAAVNREVIAVLGDGAYLLSNPVAVHHAAALHELPVLFIVMNNAMWGAVNWFTNAMYPNGAAAMSNRPEFTHLDRLPAFEQVCVAAGGYGERVERADDLPAAFDRALTIVRKEKRQALLNLICSA